MKNPLPQIDAMGQFSGDYGPGWWSKSTREETQARHAKVFSRYQDLGVERVNFFAFCGQPGSENKYQIGVVPWPRKKGTFTVNGSPMKNPYVLSNWKEKYFTAYKSFLVLMREEGVKPLVCAYMARYNWWIFRHNIEGVADFYDPEAMPYQVKFINRLLKIERDVFGADHEIWFRMINEPAHYGNHRRLHEIADWHWDAYKKSKIDKWVALENLYIDSTLSEAAHAQFVEDEACPKCTPSDTIGTGRFGGKVEPRVVKIVNHGYSIPQNLGSEFSHFTGSAWDELCLGGDGGAGDKKEFAKGHALKTPEGRVLWVQGNAVQQGRLGKKAYAAANAKGKRVGIQITMFETLAGWPLREYFDAGIIEWARIKAAMTAREEAL